MKRIQEKHEKCQGYIDDTLIDYEKSYRIDSKPNIYGCRLVYQHIVMSDGTIYDLLSQSTSTNGIFNVNIRDSGLTNKQVKTFVCNPILY